MPDTFEDLFKKCKDFDEYLKAILPDPPPKNSILSPQIGPPKYLDVWNTKWEAKDKEDVRCSVYSAAKGEREESWKRR